jgi:NitT/TauT family transport system substrate-binding protein
MAAALPGEPPGVTSFVPKAYNTTKEGVLLKKYLVFLLIAALVCGSAAWCAPKVEKVRLSEVVRSVFYAPLYVAINKGFFKEQGIDIDLSTAWGTDKSAAALVSGSVDVSLMGPEGALYVYNQGAANYLVAFAQLTKGDGSFLMGRKPMPDFDWKDLRGKTIIGARKGGMPEMVLEYVLKQNGINIQKDVNILQNIQFTATSGAFQSGVGDYIALFEPTVSVLEKEGIAHVVASFRVASGVVPYTVFHARKDMITKKAGMLQRFTNAVYKGEIWVQNHSAAQIVENIQSFFPDTDKDIVARAVKRYQAQDTWNQNPILTKAAFSRLQDIIESAGELQKRVPYERMVNTKFAVQAIKDVQE